MGIMGREKLENIVEAIKSKVKSLKGSKGSKRKKKPYAKMEKSASVKVDVMRRKARRLIDQTLKAADRPGKTSISS